MFFFSVVFANVQKIAKINQELIQKRSKGQIINLMSNDVMRFDLMCLFVNFLLIGPIQCIAMIVIEWKVYKYALVAGIGVALISQSKFSIRTNSMKPFHCTGRACDGQSLFGECPMSHPFVFDHGQQCCTLILDAEDKARETIKKYILPVQHLIFL